MQYDLVFEGGGLYAGNKFLEWLTEKLNAGAGDRSVPKRSVPSTGQELRHHGIRHE